MAIATGCLAVLNMDTLTAAINIMTILITMRNITTLLKTTNALATSYRDHKTRT